MTALTLILALSAAAGARTLDSQQKVKALCEGLQPVERQELKGVPVEAKQRVDFAASRDALFKTDFDLLVSSKQLGAMEYDEKGGSLSVPLDKPVSLMGGILEVYLADRGDQGEGLELDVLSGVGPKLVEAIRSGRAQLHLTARPAGDLDVPCTIGKARTYLLAIEVTSAELYDGQVLLAKMEEDGGLERPGKASGQPTVAVSPASLEGGGPGAEAVTARVQKAQPQLTRCYEEALKKRPDLNGSMVLVVELRKDGAASSATTVADSVLDADLASCVRKVVSGLGFPKARTGAKVTLPLSFERE